MEEQLEETKEEQQKREGELRAKIVRLEADVERFTGELHSWRLRCDTLDRIADYERREKETAMAELSYLRNGARTKGTDAVPLPPRRPRHDQVHTPNLLLQPSYATEQGDTSMGCGDCDPSGTCACIEKAIEISTNGCGKCSLDTRCQCLEDTINAADSMEILDLKRSRSPPIGYYADKRQRQHQSGSSTPLEVDFTAQFASRPVAMTISPPVVHIRLSGESCGFCEEGSYCMCAEAAAVAAAANNDHENRLAPLLNEATPPPSDTDVDGNSIKLPSMQPNQMHRPVSFSLYCLCTGLINTGRIFRSIKFLCERSRQLSAMSDRSKS